METIVIHPDQRRVALYLVLSIAFTAGGIWMIHRGIWVGWFPALFFGLGAFVFLAVLFRGSSYLVLNPNGFEWRTLFRREAYAWTQVDEFAVIHLPGTWQQPMIVFNFTDPHLSARRSARLSATFCGWDAGLPTYFQGSPYELAARMNAYMQLALCSDDRDSERHPTNCEP